MQYKAAIFDLDGTLLNSMPGWRMAVVEYLTDKGYPIPESLSDALHQYGFKLTEAIRDVPLNMTEEALRAECMRVVRAHYATDFAAKPDAIRFLDALNEAGIPCCLATATPIEMARPALERNGILTRLRFAVCDKDTEVGKSSPDFFRLIAEKCGCRPEECLVFEDALYAVRSAREAGCHVVAIADESALYQREEIRALAHRFIFSYAEILDK